MMDIKKAHVIFLFISMLVGGERSEAIIKTRNNY
jgi:hypothetical protein